MHTSVVKALNAITNGVTLSSNFTHPNDRNKTLELLLFLHRNNIFLDENLIYEWCIDKGWNTNAAVTLRDWTVQIKNGHQFRLTEHNWWNSEFLNSLLQ